MLRSCCSFVAEEVGARAAVRGQELVRIFDLSVERGESLWLVVGTSECRL